MKADAIELGVGKSSPKRGGLNRGVSILDFILRIVAILGTIGSAIAMATTNETLPFVTRFVRFRAEYNDLPMFTYVCLPIYKQYDFFQQYLIILHVSTDICVYWNRFFVVANSIVSAYLLLSLPLSIFHILRSSAERSRILFIFLDTVNPSRLQHHCCPFRFLQRPP